MKKILLILLLTSLAFGQSSGTFMLFDDDTRYSFPSAVEMQATIPNFYYDYQNVDVGSDNLLNVVIEGSSIFGANNSGVYGYADTSSCQFGVQTKLQAFHLDTLLNYSTSDLKYYNRYNPAIVYGGSWYPENGQWASYYSGGKKYVETDSNGAYAEIVVTGVKYLAIVFEAQNAGDSMITTINSVLPSAAGITGKDTISTYYGRVGYFISLKHEYYSGLDPATTYTFRFTKLRNDPAKYCKIAGFMTWKLPSINFITTAESGMSGASATSRFYETVTVHNPDLVIWQTHDVNDIYEPTLTYGYHSDFLDSLNSHNYEYIVVIPNPREPENAGHLEAYNNLKPLFVSNNIPYLDFYQYFKEKVGSDTYDGTHPNAASILDYVNTIGAIFGTLTNRNALYYASMTTQLDSTQKARINDLTTMLADSLHSADPTVNDISDKFDFLYLFANGTEDAGLKNLARRSFDAVNIHSTAWTQYQGFTGDGANDYINTTYRLGVDTINVRRYSNAYGVYARTNTTEASKVLMGGYNSATSIFSRLFVSGTSNLTFSLNQTSGVSYSGDNKGLLVGSRLADNDIKVYKNGVQVGSGTTTASALPNITVPILTQITHLGSKSGYSAREVAIAFWSSGLTITEQRMIKNCFEVYMDSMGTGIIP